MPANPLLRPIDTLLDYAAIRPEHIAPAITQLLAQARDAITGAADPAPGLRWETLMPPIQAASNRLWRAWSAVSHLNAVVNTPALRDAYNACLPQITEFSTWAGMHPGLYACYQALHAQGDTHNATQQRVLTLALRNMRLSGVALPPEGRARYAALSEQQAQLAQKFSENVLDTIDRWFLLVTDEAQLDGLPPDVRQAARAAAEKDGQPGYKLTLHMPCYLPVMQYANDRHLRETLYRAYGTIASEQGDTALDNSPLIEQLLALRAEEAALLGYAHFADLRLQTRMAQSATQVQTFLRDLASKAKPPAQRDLARLRAFATTLGIAGLQPWDIAWVTEKLRQQQYAYSEDEVRHYFTAPQVLQGLFDVIHTLFDVTLHPEPASLWHPDAQMLRVADAQGQTLGHLILDLYARPGKQSGAWVDSERVRHRLHNVLLTPVVMLTCNFPNAQDGFPACLTHDDVITLFHESGHALHALLSTQEEPALSPFASVEWDAIELPSQFMENFCWDWHVVQKLSRHRDSGAHLPRALFDKMLAARHFQSGMHLVRQIEFALFDMLIHTQDTRPDMTQVQNILHQVRAEVAVIIPPAWHRFAHNFSHIFAGGYGAGYYSYLWAEVYSADTFAAFEEAAQGASVLHAASGQRFRDAILAPGGSRPMRDAFYTFRGREVSMDALLRHNGLH